MTPQAHIALDFESYYDTRVSVKKMGVREYLTQPETEIYLVTAYAGNEFKSCSKPESFD